MKIIALTMADYINDSTVSVLVTIAENEEKAKELAQKSYEVPCGNKKAVNIYRDKWKLLGKVLWSYPLEEGSESVEKIIDFCEMEDRMGLRRK